MSARECYGVVVRTSGLIVTLYGLYSLANALSIKLALRSADSLFGSPAMENVAGAPMLAALVTGGASVFVGLCLMFGASAVVNLSYRSRTREEKPSRTAQTELRMSPP